VYTGVAQGVVFRSVPKTRQSIILLVSEFGAYLIAASIAVEISTALFLGYYINDLNRVIMNSVYAFSIVTCLLAIQAAYEVRTIANIINSIPSFDNYSLSSPKATLTNIKRHACQH